MPTATSCRCGVIEGPKTQLNWPTGISVDSERQEIYVSNAAGDSINVYSATANGDVAPIRQIKGPKTMLRNPNGVSIDPVNGEVWVANFGNHTATAYRRDANGNAEPIRVIRSAPLNAPTTLINNPYMIAFDGRRDEVLVPNCVAQPRIAAYSTAADKGTTPSRIIEGQKTNLNRTVHAIAYDDIHDEIVVQSNIGQAVVTYRGGANGDEAPIRIIQGPKTLLRDPVSLFIDPVHNEIFVFNMGTDDTMLVFDRMAQGDVAPKRVLKSPGAVGGVGAADPVTNRIFINGRNNGILVYDRTAEGNDAATEDDWRRTDQWHEQPRPHRRAPADAQHPRHAGRQCRRTRREDGQPDSDAVRGRVVGGRRGRRAAALYPRPRPHLHAARPDARPEEEDGDRQRQVPERGPDVLAAGDLRPTRRP